MNGKKFLVFNTSVVKIITAIIVSLICLHLSNYYIYQVVKGPDALDSIPIKKLKNQYVKAKFTYNVGAFYENRNEKKGKNMVNERYYIIPIGKEEYICVVFDKKNMGIAEELYKNTYAYLEGSLNKLTKSFQTEGFIYRMKGEQLKSYYNWFAKSGALGTSDKTKIKKYALPYKIVLGKKQVFKMYFLTGIALLSILYACYLTLRNLTKLYYSRKLKHSIN